MTLNSKLTEVKINSSLIEDLSIKAKILKLPKENRE